MDNSFFGKTFSVLLIAYSLSLVDVFFDRQSTFLWVPTVLLFSSSYHHNIANIVESGVKHCNPLYKPGSVTSMSCGGGHLGFPIGINNRNFVENRSSFKTCHWTFSNSNETDATSRAGTAYPVEVLEFRSVFVVIVLLNLLTICRLGATIFDVNDIKLLNQCPLEKEQIST